MRAGPIGGVVVLAVVGALLVTACGSDDATTVRSPTTTTVATPPAPSTTGTRLTLVEFAAAADKVCIATFPKVNALEDPDGEGGNKPVGLGHVVRQWADDLAAITPPDAIAAEWAKATDLLRQSGVRLDDAERLAAVGDPRSGDAQGEALWSLQPAAAEIITGLGVPFKACFVE